MRTIAVDFDLVIHDGYRGYDDGSLYGEPIEGAKFTLDNLIKKYNVVILTSRTEEEWPKMRVWLEKYQLPQLEITNTKPKNMQALIDNRAIRFVSWADVASYFL